MQINMRIDRDSTPEMMDQLDAAINRFVRKGSAVIKSELKLSQAKSKSGRRYERGDKFHVASAPGESPAVESSNLIGSIDTIFPSTLESKTGTPVEYGLFLEKGTDNIEPRPLWKVTRDAVVPTLEAMLQGEIAAIS